MSKNGWNTVNRRSPCEICGKDDWCARAEDGVARCMRASDPPPGWSMVKRCDDGGVVCRQSVDGLPPGAETVQHDAPPRDWVHEASDFSRAITPERLLALAGTLGVLPDSLETISVGWHAPRGCWTFPECDGDGRVIGIALRLSDGSKNFIKHGRRGLVVPSKLAQLPDPVFIVEGPSDVAAAVTLGVAAVGRPNNRGGVEHLARLLRDRKIIIVGEFDPKPDGSWPGRDGAQAVAGNLATKWKKALRWALMPDNAKDVRSWLGGQNIDLHEETACRAAGRKLVAAIESAAIEIKPGTGVASVDWEPPVPLGHFNLPEFPIESFPTGLCVFREFCAAVAESYQVPIDMPAMLILAVGAAALAKRVKVHVRGDHHEPVNIFVSVAMEPANRKSGVFRTVAQPLQEFERSENERLAPIIEERQTEREILEKRLEEAKKKASRAKPGTERKKLAKDALDLTEELRQFEVLFPPRYVADDATPERLTTLLKHHGGRMALLSPEGDTFDLMAGRYSKNGCTNLGVYLKAHAGDDIRVDRVARPSEFVQEPALTLGLAVQPDVLCGLMAKPGFRGRGLLGRFLYSMPVSTLGHRKVASSAIPPAVASAYREVLECALRLEPARNELGREVSHILEIGKDALYELDRFATSVERDLGDGGQFEAMRDWGGKLVGAVCRIAGIFHGLQAIPALCPSAKAIDAETMLCAIAIGEYCVPHAKAAYHQMGADPAVRLAERLIKWLRNERVTQFSKRDAFNSIRGMIHRVDELEIPLQLLCDHSFVRLVENDRPGPGRRPSPKYEVNPIFLAQNTQNTHNALDGLNSTHSAQRSSM